MIPFPDEESRTEHILECAHMEFEFAERAYRVWMETGKWPKRGNTPRKVFDLGMMLNLQGCRL